jgi:uncharacterized protein (TIGR02145 family)
MSRQNNSLRLLIAGVLSICMLACTKDDGPKIYNTFKDPADGKTYRTIVIGGLEWFADNLNKGQMINSTALQTNNEVIEKYCYDNDTKNCERFGGLYTWDEMMAYVSEPGTQGICPDGWWIPTDANWKELEMTLGMSNQEANSEQWRSLDIGEAMKTKGSSNFAGTLSGHWFHGDMEFYSLNQMGSWWSSDSEPTHAWKRSLGKDEGPVYRALSSRQYGYSVRCVRFASQDR